MVVKGADVKPALRTVFFPMRAVLIVFALVMASSSATATADGSSDDCVRLTQDACVDMSDTEDPLLCDIDIYDGRRHTESCHSLIPQGELYDWVVWNTFYPDEVRLPKPFTLPVEVTNKKDFPVAVTVDYSVPETDVCSVTNQGMSQVVSGATEITSKMVLLAPQGETLPTGEKDHATMRLRATPEAPGQCTFTVTAAVAAAGVDVIPPAEQEVSFEVLPELVEEVDLGTFSYDCGSNAFDHDDGPTTGADVRTGERSVYYTQVMTAGTGSCKGKTFFTHVDWEYDGGDVERPTDLSSQMTGPVANGRQVAQELDLQAGDHEFTIHGIIKEGSVATWECAGAIVTHGAEFVTVLAGALAAYNHALLLTYLLAMVFGGPIAIGFFVFVMAVLAGVIVLTAAYAVTQIIDACSASVTNEGSSPTINVLAEDDEACDTIRTRSDTGSDITGCILGLPGLDELFETTSDLGGDSESRPAGGQATLARSTRP